MNRISARRSAVWPAATLAAIGIVLAGCGPNNSSPGSGGTGASGSSSSPASGGSGGSSGSGSGSGSSSYFPYALGDTWVYDVTIAGRHGTTTNTVTAVTPVSGGNKVTFSSKESIPGLPSTPLTLSYIVHSDGSISTPFVQSPGETTTITSGGIVWPALSVLQAGTPQHEAFTAVVKTAGESVSVHANVVVKGDGTQSVTVPAGTYQALVVEETFAEKVEGISVTSVVKTFLAPGVGPIETVVQAGALGASKSAALDELKSFTKG